MFSFRRLISSPSKRRLFSTALPAHAAPGDRSGFIQLAVHKDNIGLLGTAVAAGCILFQLTSVSGKVDKVDLTLKSLDDKISLKFDNQSRNLKDIERHLVNLIVSTRQQSRYHPLQQPTNEGEARGSEKISDKQ